MTEAHRDEYLSLFSEPGALTAALNWYRAMGEGEALSATEMPPIEIPVLFIWGNGDPAVARYTVEAQKKYLGEFQSIELNAGHWLMEEETSTTTSAVVAFIERQTSTESVVVD